MKTYTIKEVSLMFDLPASTLRYYEDMALLEGVERNESKQRIYTKEHICRLNAINCFKNTGLSIAKIKEFFILEKDTANNIDKIINLLKEHEHSTKEQIAKMQSDLKHIQEKICCYTSMKGDYEKKYRKI